MVIVTAQIGAEVSRDSLSGRSQASRAITALATVAASMSVPRHPTPSRPPFVGRETVRAGAAATRWKSTKMPRLGMRKPPLLGFVSGCPKPRGGEHLAQA